ncbi:RdRP-domain-containing protein [Xylariaceae sp. FL0255]|nr:RdRP-domain-containing protein [Xylariaceae sp. FL0255]
MESTVGYSVFMGGVPQEITEQVLNTQVSSIMNRLNIESFNCQKPRNKTFAILTFLHREDGMKFLKQHGQVRLPGLSRKGHPQFKSQLIILGKSVYCKESDRLPDDVLLRVLAKEAEDRQAPSEDVQETQQHKSVVFATVGLTCGHYDYPNTALSYNADVAWKSLSTAKFARYSLILPFEANGQSLRVEIPYRTIQEMVICTSQASFFLTLLETPRIFIIDSGGGQPQMELITALMGNTTISLNYFRPQPRIRTNAIPHVNSAHDRVIGQSMVYCVSLSPQDFELNLGKLKKEKDFLPFSYQHTPLRVRNRVYMSEAMDKFNLVVEKHTTRIPFDVLFQFQALVWNGYLLPQTVEQLLLRFSEAITERQHHDAVPSSGLPFSSDSIKKLFPQIPFPSPGTEANMFDANELWSLLQANEREIQQGLAKGLRNERSRQNVTLVYKLQVTPSRILLKGPEPEAKNRILRKTGHVLIIGDRFPLHLNYFARVQFCDEDGQDLYFNPKVSLDSIYARFRSILRNGICIAGRVYKFLGFSHSSLRSHAVWFMANFTDENKQLRSYATVIREIGNFRGIRSPARCAARIGQAFSETPVAVNLQALGAQIEFIPDIRSKDGSRIFSDGVGTISRDLMEAIRDVLPQHSNNATCFQIRWAGAKGMLSLDETLNGTVMRIRPSMNKFESDDAQNLEICDQASKPIPLVLNRQMIKILEDMKVSDSWFIKMQSRELDRLRKITSSTDNTVVFLRRQKIANQMKFAQFIRRLDNLGMDYKRDAFLSSVVETTVLREVRLLKHKARIPVEHGVTLFGVMDEFGYLRDEEVFITFDRAHGQQCPNLHGRSVIITRSPALHPGDIQIRRAIVPPQDHPLSSLTNCIVFSQTGDRDLPSQLSGGDLDGDIYNIIWDPEPIESCEYEFAPAEYPRVQPLDIRRDVIPDDMTDFFVTFMATDQLPIIATRHQILADIVAAGTVHDDCKKLAEMHSTAVDYSKTGIPVDMQKMSSVKRTVYRPDFMAPAPPANIVDRTEIRFEPLAMPSGEEDEDDETGPRHKFYKSSKILGKLYRSIDEKKIWRDDIHASSIPKGSPLWKQLFLHLSSECESLGVIDWRSALQEAGNIRNAYEDMMRAATLDHSDHASIGITELEVFTGAIFNKSGVQTRRQRDTSVRLKDEFDRITKWTEGLIRKEDQHYPTEDEDQDSIDYDGPGNDQTSQRASHTGLELSMACLHVGMAETKHQSGLSKRGDDDFKSFKVIAAHCALRELDTERNRKDVAAGARILSGGFPGVKSGRR